MHFLFSGHFDVSEIIKYYKEGWNHVGALLIFFVVNYLHHKADKEFNEKNNEAIGLLRSLQSELPISLYQYSLQKLNVEVAKVKVSINNLLSVGLHDQTLTEKIEIIKALVKNCEEKKISYFWTTSYDLPSTLIENFSDYFSEQEKYLNNVLGNTIDKSRVVIITEEQLKSEIYEFGDKLREFIKWHTINGFQLRFLLNYNHTFESMTHQMVKTGIMNNDYLNDFAIIGESWIYGEATLLRGSNTTIQEYLKGVKIGTNERKKIVKNFNRTQGEKQNILTIRLFENTPSNQQVWREYKQLYHKLWYDWHHSQWPIMTSQQVMSEIERIESLRSTQSQRIQFYFNKYPSLKGQKGPQFCAELFKIFQSFENKNIFATDLLSLKVDKEYSKWNSKNYQEWIKINADLAKHKRCEIHRIYIINKKIAIRSQASEKNKLIFTPQIDAGINLYFIDYKELVNKNITFLDFVLVENELCASTQWHEHFEDNTYSVENNIDDMTQHPAYIEMFNVLLKNSQKINEWTDEDRIAFLLNLT